LTGNEMGLTDHLEELRRRIIISCLAILAAALVFFFFSDTILRILLLPSGGLKLRAFGILDGFMIKLRLALYAGIVAAFPVWAYQIIRFVGPGLLPGEKRAIRPMLSLAVILFMGGTAFGYYMLWGMIKVLIELFPAQIEFMPQADAYLSFVVFFLLSCGLAFQLPCVLLILVNFRLLGSQTLRTHRRIAYFALFAFAEIITPVSDPIIAPLTVMAPLVILYELSILLSRRIEDRRNRSTLESGV
jgi:sec-independent protein translocase protein TatC